MKTVFDIYDYREACKFLQDKYDVLGYTRKSYYRLDESGNFTYGRTGKLQKNDVGHGADGLQYHHICEDTVPSLSDQEVARANNPEYQSADNMCYCNLLEHLWLHILITEQKGEAAENDQEDITGRGGVQWLMLGVNSIMANPAESWYSKKGYAELKEHLEEEDSKGCNYDKDQIISSNEDIWLRVVNYYCTSAFIRTRLNLTSEEILSTIVIAQKALPNEDKGVVIEKMTDAVKSNPSKLKDWNLGAYANLEAYLRTGRSALVQICTGGGKTTTALEYVRVHRLAEKEVLVLGPSDNIKSGWIGYTDKDGITVQNGVMAANYQTFMGNYKTWNWSEIKVLICDEVHHIDAERWGEGIKWVLANQPHVKLIGLTATPNTKQAAGTDPEFEGRVCYGLDLAAGIEEGHIWPFSYIQSIYELEETEKEFKSYGARGTLLWERLSPTLNANPVEVLLRKHMRGGTRKGIVFVDNRENFKSVRAILVAYDSKYADDKHCRYFHSGQSDEEKADIRDWMNCTGEHEGEDFDKFIITVAMVNEGVHFKGINTLVMFRRTRSARLFVQQLGRLIVTTEAQTWDPEGIVFDLSNNAANLIANGETVRREEAASSDAETIKRVKAAIKSLAGKEVIVEDYTEDCVNVLMSLRDCSTSTVMTQRVMQAYDEVKVELGDLLEEDIFEESWWLDLKKADSVQRPKIGSTAKAVHATGSASKKAFADAGVEKTKSNKSTPSTFEDRLFAAFKVGLCRAYAWEAIDFVNGGLDGFTVRNESDFEFFWQQLGFKNFDIIKKMITKLGTRAFIAASSLDTLKSIQ